MTRVKKGGCEYRVDDSVVEEYLAKGYSILDERGNTIRTGSPTTYSALLTENAELRQAIKRLESSNASLAAQVAEGEKRKTEMAETVDRLTAENSELRQTAENQPQKQVKTKAEAKTAKQPE